MTDSWFPSSISSCCCSSKTPRLPSPFLHHHDLTPSLCGSLQPPPRMGEACLCLCTHPFAASGLWGRGPPHTYASESFLPELPSALLVFPGTNSYFQLYLPYPLLGTLAPNSSKARTVPPNPLVFPCLCGFIPVASLIWERVPDKHLFFL